MAIMCVLMQAREFFLLITSDLTSGKTSKYTQSAACAMPAPVLLCLFFRKEKQRYQYANHTSHRAMDCNAASMLHQLNIKHIRV